MGLGGSSGTGRPTTPPPAPKLTPIPGEGAQAPARLVFLVNESDKTLRLRPAKWPNRTHNKAYTTPNPKNEVEIPPGGRAVFDTESEDWPEKRGRERLWDAANRRYVTAPVPKVWLLETVEEEDP